MFNIYNLVEHGRSLMSSICLVYVLLFYPVTSNTLWRSTLSTTHSCIVTSLFGISVVEQYSLENIYEHFITFVRINPHIILISPLKHLKDLLIVAIQTV